MLVVKLHNRVTYIDSNPLFATSVAEELRVLATRISKSPDVVEAKLLIEISRPERFALIETWTESTPTAAREAPAYLDATGFLCSPPDERAGEAFSTGAALPSDPTALNVLVHIDVVPFNLALVGEWLRAEAEAARLAAGALSYEIWRQADRPNHFTAIQVWADHAAYAQHLASETTRAFRANLLTMKGALYDERLYHQAH